MLRMPMKTLAASFALALAVLLITAPFTGVALATVQPDGCMMIDDGGSAHFDPNELPESVTRDFDGGCEWWKYELVGGKYVRKYSPCKYGNKSADTSINPRGIYANAVSDGSTETVAAAPPIAEIGVDAAQSDDAEVETAVNLPVQAESREDGLSKQSGSEEGSVAATALPAEVESREDAFTGVEVENAKAEPVVEVVEAVGKDFNEGTPEDIIETLAERNQYATILAAVGATELSDELHAAGPYTVFAPNDEAFAAALPGGDLDDYLMEASEQLRNIVLYHLVPGLYGSDTLTNGAVLPTLQGGELVITVEGDSVMVNDVNIVATDIEVSNGVVHLIDGILQPPGE